MKASSIIPLPIKLNMLYWWNRFFPKLKIETGDKQVVWFFLAADYGNLGDVAITLAQTSFLKRKFPDADVRSIPISQTLQYIGAVHKVVAPKDIICLVGGGNMSDLYSDIEFLRQLVIKNFYSNRIISFPQSVYFTDAGQAILDKSRKIYSKHSNLTLMAREKASFHRMKKYFPKNNVILIPDIVLTLDKRKNYVRDKSVLFCLRKDKEQMYADISEIPSLKRFLDSQASKKLFIDTQIADDLVRNDGGEKHVNILLEQFSHAGIVVTDRLHGMILAFITGTPALVFDNSTKKISETYEWIKDCGFIHLVDEKTDFSSISFTDNFSKTQEFIGNIFMQLL